MDKIEVSIELKETSQPIVRQAVSTYTKGPMFCVYDGPRMEKYPIESIVRITESYAIERIFRITKSYAPSKR